ncbi:hypothetical protein N9406_00395 [Verrucomicrobiales bacterium]|nr:hypothetical protein [Verrucomicrobiales bacterium]MDB3939394.1 hypothetical protein [Verrucomicrobiales bacterium]MDC3352831.1 hypothetical protein [Verrucomicrobiales bacterium]
MSFRNKCFAAMAILALPLLFTQCETMDMGGSPAKSMTVQGTLFYPDEVNTTFIVPAGAQVIGANGKDCHFIVHEGGLVTAHAGDGNTFKIAKGGHFRGFAHSATNCIVTYQAGAVIEQELLGPGTRFEPL